MQLIPRDAQFYDMFGEVAKRLTGSATLLHEAFKNPAELEGDVAKIKVLEHECDNLTRDIIERIDRTFVTPFDREDIHSLATTLDDVVDLIDGAGRRAVIFHITEVRPHCVKLSEVLFRAACCIEDTVKKMKDPKAVSAGNRQLNLLEEEGDAIYHDGMDVLFSNATDAILVVKWKELFDRIEDAIDRCEDVGNVLQTISLKNA